MVLGNTWEVMLCTLSEGSPLPIERVSKRLTRWHRLDNSVVSFMFQNSPQNQKEARFLMNPHFRPPFLLSYLTFLTSSLLEHLLNKSGHRNLWLRLCFLGTWSRPSIYCVLELDIKQDGQSLYPSAAPYFLKCLIFHTLSCNLRSHLRFASSKFLTCQIAVRALALSERTEQQQRRVGFSSSRAHQLHLPINTSRPEPCLLLPARLLLL